MRPTSLRISSLLAAVAALAAAPAPAAEPPPGRLLASHCSQCHGTNGVSAGGFPSIAGKSQSAMYNQLINIKYGAIKGIMSMQARAYTDGQLWLIAGYYSTQKRN
jgi:sulfide dehydrogenase cytochrome subunit